MEFKQLKVAFRTGGLKSATVTYAPMQRGCYILIVQDKDNNKHVMRAQRSDEHEARVFKSIDAAVANASKIGFKTITVQL